MSFSLYWNDMTSPFLNCFNQANEHSTKINCDDSEHASELDSFMEENVSMQQIVFIVLQRLQLLLDLLD